MTPDELTRLKELHEQASPAPWLIDYDTEPRTDSDNVISALKGAHGEYIIEQWGCGCCGIGLEAKNPTDFELAVENRNALPGLLDHIDKLTRRLEIYEARLGRVARSNPDAYAEALAGDAQ